MTYFGHIVSERGVAPDPAKIKSVKGWPTPTNVTEVRSFLGLAAYYRRFIKDFSKVASPLHRLTEKGRVFSWDETCQTAFEELKVHLTSAPVLAYPKLEAKFILDTDASDVAIGAVLSQKFDEREHVIAYGSRCLSKAERRYCVTRKELLAIVYFVKYFRHYLYGRQFLLRTDHFAGCLISRSQKGKLPDGLKPCQLLILTFSTDQGDNMGMPMGCRVFHAGSVVNIKLR